MEGATSEQEDAGERDDGDEPEHNATDRDPTDLDAPDDDADLYETYGTEQDDPLRPVFQGDVFTGATLLGYEPDDHDAVMLVGHPCSLRKGAELRERLQAVAVRHHQHVSPRRWRTTEKQCFPLPALDDGKPQRADLREIGVVTHEQLDSARRMATLSQRGILLLQQRIVWTFARTVVRLDTFAEHNAPQLIELELLEYWNEQLCGKCSPAERDIALRGTAEQFEKHMRDDGWRKLLEQPDRRTEVRRVVRQEAERRCGTS